MKPIIIIVILLLLSISVKAQKVPYEKLEAFSKEISQFQLEVNGKSYNDGTNNIEISFPEENFTVSFESQLATNVVYLKKDNKELMYLSENIDMAKVKGITVELIDGKILLYKLHFDVYYFFTKIFENDVLIDTTIHNNLVIYAKYNENYSATVPSICEKLCLTLQKERGMITDEEISEQNVDYVILSKEEFVKKHPNSIKSMQVQNIFNEKKIVDEKRGEIELINYNPSNFKLGLSIEDTKKEYQDLQLKISKKKNLSEEFDELISKNGDIKFLIKNNVICGYIKVLDKVDLKGHYSDEGDKLYLQGKSKIEDLKYIMIKKFSTDPLLETTVNTYISDGEYTTYIWSKNLKKVKLRIDYKEKLRMMDAIYSYSISEFILDENLTRQ